MIRSLFLRGLRLHAGLMLVLSLGLVLFEWAIVWVAARMGMGPSLQQMLTTLFPSDVVETVFNQFGFASFRGAMSFGYQHPLTLVAGIAMVTVMATVPADERESGLLDLVLSRPLPRARYLAANGLLVALAAVLCPLALLAGGTLGIAVVEAPEVVAWTSYLPPAGALALLLLAVGAYTLFFAAGARRRGVAVAQGVVASLLFYWLDFMGEYWDLLGKPRILSPFYYFDPALAANHGIPLTHAVVLGGVTLVATVGAFVRFGRQDL